MAVRTRQLIGRQDALARLEAAAERASAGDPAIVLIEGEAGIGKSRLVAELLSTATQRGALTLFGSCPPIAGPDLPLAPIVQGLRGLARSTSEEEAAGVFGPSRSVLSALVPSLAGPGDSGPPGSVSLGLVFEHLLAVLERLSARHDLVILVIDDIHWGGPTTWDLVAHLARNLAAARVLVLATFRRDALSADGRASQFLVELRRSSLIETIELHGLSPEEAAELVNGLARDRDAGSALSPAAVQALVARANGNPFFIEELVGAAGHDGGPGAKAGQVPETLRATIRARIDAQPEEVVRVLRVASVIGRRADAELLIDVAGYRDEVVIEALHRAVRAGLLTTVPGAGGDGYAFGQELVREVVYADLVPGERSRLHGAVARALAARLDPGPATADRAIELATHWRESGDTVHAVPALLKAADAAQAAYAFVEAHRLYEQGFALIGTGTPAAALPGSGSGASAPKIGFRMAPAAAGPEWADIHARAAEAASLAGEPSRAIEHIDTAIETGAGVSPTVFRWRERRARYLLEAGHEGESLDAYRDLSSHADELGVADRPRLLVAHARALTLVGRYREAGAVAETALAVAREVQHASEEWQALNLVGTARAFAGRPEEGLEALTEARRLSQHHRTDSVVHPRPSRIGELLGDRLSAARALEQAGRPADALDVALEGAATADRLGAARWRGELDVAAGWQLYRQGRWADVRERCDELLAAGGAATTEVRVLRGQLNVAQGRMSEADDDLAAAEIGIARTSRADLVARYHLAVAELALWRRRNREASTAIADALSRLGDSEDRFARAELCALGLRAEVELRAEAQLRRAGGELAAHDEAAARWLGEVRALLAGDTDGSVAGSRAVAILSTAAAEFSRLADSDAAAWTDAVAATHAIGDVYAAACARWRLAEALLGGREGRARAADELRLAFNAASELGALPLREEIAALAARARIDLEAAAPEAPAAPARPGSELGLSDRELEVLALLAVGRTNRQIADELFITEKTAGHHVSNILSKLGVANRLEAASIAHRAAPAEPRSGE